MFSLFFHLPFSLFLFLPSVHAAVLAINEAIDGGDHTVTLTKLQNPAAVLEDIEPENSPRYQSSLETTKKDKKGIFVILMDVLMYMYIVLLLLYFYFNCMTYCVYMSFIYLLLFLLL